MCLTPFLLLLSLPVNVAAVYVSTFLGNGSAYDADGYGTSTALRSPSKIAANASGYLYFATGGGYTIRMSTPSGYVTTFAGSTSSSYVNGVGVSARFKSASGFCFDSNGNVYVPDQSAHAIRMITQDRTVSTFAGALPDGINAGTSGYVDDVGTAARFSQPMAYDFDSQGNMFVADSTNHAVRKITPNGTVTTVAGSGASGFQDGTGTNAQFNSPQGIAVSPSGDLYVSDTNNYRIRKVTQSGVVTTIAGNSSSLYADGNGSNAAFKLPRVIAYGPDDNLYVLEPSSYRIRKVTLLGNVTTYVGKSQSGYLDGDESIARFSNPLGMAINPSGVMFVADSVANRVRMVTNTSTTTSTSLSTTVEATSAVQTTLDTTSIATTETTATLSTFSSLTTDASTTVTTTISSSSSWLSTTTALRSSSSSVTQSSSVTASSTVTAAITSAYSTTFSATASSSAQSSVTATASSSAQSSATATASSSAQSSATTTQSSVSMTQYSTAWSSMTPTATSLSSSAFIFSTNLPIDTPPPQAAPSPLW
ncbi:hypothetical protein EDD86DRAFT_213646 [Gorgonomyces haynaldii]|nr:hypothetical protein EDD86DRAFT_213646 [Gorgonomyces haynaldii]